MAKMTTEQVEKLKEAMSGHGKGKNLAEKIGVTYQTLWRLRKTGEGREDTLSKVLLEIEGNEVNAQVG